MHIHHLAAQAAKQYQKTRGRRGDRVGLGRVARHIRRQSRIKADLAIGRWHRRLLLALHFGEKALIAGRCPCPGPGLTDLIPAKTAAAAKTLICASETTLRPEALV